MRKRLPSSPRRRRSAGANKLTGEHARRAANPRSVILRTAWVVSAQRSNFLKTMLRLGACRARLQVVADQVGCPTAATDIAAAVTVICDRLLQDADAACGTYHFAGEGATSWHGLATEIFAAAARHGGGIPVVEPVSSSEYPTRAARPANSRLSTEKITRELGIAPRPLREAVHAIVDELCRQEIAG